MECKAVSFIMEETAKYLVEKDGKILQKTGIVEELFFCPICGSQIFPGLDDPL